MKLLLCGLALALGLLVIACPSQAQTLPGRYDLAQDPEFMKAIRIAMVETAIAIIGEATSGNIIVDDKRATLAIDVLNNVEQYLPRFALGVAADPTATTATDSTIRNRISGIWNKYAGVRGNEAANPE